MSTLAFKTNINCNGCLAKVSPKLNQLVGEGQWKVDLQSPAKTLTVEAANATDAGAVAEAVQQAGFCAELVEANP